MLNVCPEEAPSHVACATRITWRNEQCGMRKRKINSQGSMLGTLHTTPKFRSSMSHINCWFHKFVVAHTLFSYSTRSSVASSGNVQECELTKITQIQGPNVAESGYRDGYSVAVSRIDALAVRRAGNERPSQRSSVPTTPIRYQH